MKVRLLQMTQSPIDIMWAAARTCYSKRSPIEMWEEINRDGNKFNVLEMDKRWNLIEKILESKHESICEHVNFTFAIEGISRACLAQITRHRTGIVFSVMSQRYVEIKENYEKIRDLVVSIDSSSRYFNESTCKGKEQELIGILDKYFVNVNEDNIVGYGQALMQYLRATNRGKKAEDARNFLPNATKTNLVMTINLRELMHVSNLRLCTRAQLEIRRLFQEIKKEVEKQEPHIAELLVPSCKANHGICSEHNSCGLSPTFEEVMSVYKGEYEDEI